MASTNLDLVRSIFAARERGDFTDARWADPQIEYVVADGPSPDTFKGLTGLAQAMRELLSAWEGIRIEVDEYRELDEERVLVVVHSRGRGKVSGLELDALSTAQYEVVHRRRQSIAASASSCSLRASSSSSTCSAGRCRRA
jgi:hypothetical protein